MTTAPDNPLLDVVSDAIVAVGDALPSQNMQMDCDGVVAPVSLLSSLDAGAEPATADGPAETARILANVRDFPALSIESLITLDGRAHIITSLSKTGNAAWFVGISDALEHFAATYTGRRGARNLSLPLDVLAGEGARIREFPSALAPAMRNAWYVVVRRDDWPETSDPVHGDAVSFYDAAEGREKFLSVCAVQPRRGYFVLSARER